MKLAVALQLRTTITEAIQRQPSPIIAHRTNSVALTQRSNITGTGGGPIGQPKPLTDVKNFRVGPLDGLDEYLKTLPPAKGILEFDVETQQMYRQLEALDAAIQTANFTVKHAIPASIPIEPGDIKGVKKTLASFLLRRKTLKERATRLEQFLAAVPQRANTSRVKRDDNVDEVTIVYPLVDHEEVRSTYNKTMMSLRAVDNLIQQANWAVDVDVPPWVRQGFLTEDVEPVVETKGPKPVKVTAEPAAEVSPVAPMLAVPGAAPALVAKGLVVPTLAPAAATPTAGTGIFVPPDLDASDPTADDTDGEGWSA